MSTGDVVARPKREIVKLTKWYGWLGLGGMLVATAFVALGNDWAARFYTPVVWTGYIMAVDAFVLRRRGRSLITSSPREFVLLLWVSTLCWLVFEVYNFRVRNWQYINLPQSSLERDALYLWAFATISPAFFESVDLLETFGLFKRQDKKPGHRESSFWLSFSISIGLAFLVIPFLVPSHLAGYTFGFGLVGFFFLLEPLTYRLGAPSLLRDWQEGRRRRLYLLLASGALCGLLWESWNFYTLQFGGLGWIYILPYPINLLADHIRIGRMPLLGFFGFLPHAVVTWDMWQFVRALLLPEKAHAMIATTTSRRPWKLQPLD